MEQCEYCGAEHPPDQIANPHYCIARLGEQLEREEERSLKAFEKYEERIEEKDERIKELEESHDAWEAGWRTMYTALLKAQERIKELEETIHNLRHPLSINPDEYVGDEIGGE